jgi:hypothetical protein
MMVKSAKTWAFGLHEYITERPILEGRKNRIIPEQQYVMQEEGTTDVGPIRGWSKGQVLTGSQVIGLYENVQSQNRQASLENIKSSSLLIKQVKGLPEGTTFIPTETGYKINIPESVKLEQAKTAIKQYEGLPPIVSQIALVGFYLESNLLSMGKPVADVLGKTKEYNIATSFALASGGSFAGTKEYAKNVGMLIKTTEYDVHYSSVWDIAFEPLGMSPKGSVDVLRQHPLEAAIGNIGAEATTWVMFSGVAKAGTKAAGKTFEIVAPKIYSTAGRINLEFGARLGRFVPSVLKETSVVKNIGLFTKGYRPTLVMAPGRTIIGKETMTIGEDITGKIITQKTPYALNLERKFLSPIAYGEATKNLSLKLSTRSIDIGFPSLKYEGRSSYLVSAVSQKSYTMKGVFSKQLVERGEYGIFKKPATQISIDKNIMSIGEFAEYSQRRGILDIMTVPGWGEKGGTYFASDVAFPKRIYIDENLPNTLSESFKKSFGFSSGRQDSVYKIPTKGEIARHEITHYILETKINPMETFKGPASYEEFTRRLAGRTEYITRDLEPLSKNLKPIDIYGNILERTSSKTEYGSFMRIGKTEYAFSRIETSGQEIISKSGSIPTLESEIISPIQQKYYASIQYMGINKPYSKKWIEEYREPFWRNTRAQQELLEPIQLTKPETGMNVGRFNLSTIIIPSQMGEISILPKIATYSTLRSSKIKFSYEQGELTIPETKRDFGNVPKFAMLGVMDLSMRGSRQNKISIDLSDIARFSITDVLTEQKTMKDVMSLSQPVSIPNVVSIPFIPFLPLSSLTGGAGGGYGSKRRRKKGSRYRIHPVELYDVLYLSKKVAI